MRSFVAVLLATITSTFAYQVTSPGLYQNWTTAGTNTLTWTRVSTDPLNFTVVLTNVNYGFSPQVLNALVDGTLGQIACNPPSGGWPTGSGYRVNLAADATHLDTLLAQSDQFSINAATSSGSTSATSTGTGTGTGTGSSASTSPMTTGTGTATSAGASSSSSSSLTGTSPSSTGGAVMGMNVEMGFLTAAAAIVAFVTTRF